MTIQEACQRLGKSESTIRRWIRQGTLTATKVDDIWDIPESVVNDYLNDQVTKGSDKADDQGLIGQLRNENEYLKGQIEEKDKQISELHQMLMVSEGNQKQMLEDKRPFWRRWPRKRKTDDEGG